MIEQNTDFFAYVDNFAEKSKVDSICIFDNCSEVPSVTIGIPTYKRVLTLKDTIESALAQECEFEYKILVLDNNPVRDDETEQFMREYADNLAVSYYKNSENLGMGGNWNRIFTIIESEWIVLLHDDDLIAPSFLKDMLKVAEKYDADVVNSAFIFWLQKESDCPSFFFKQKEYDVIKSSLGANFFYNRAGMPTGILYRREVYLKEGGVNDEYYPAQDWVSNSLLSYKYNYLIYTKPLTIYRYAVNTYMKKETTEAYMPIIYIFMHYIGKLLNFPKWFVNMYTCMEVGVGVSRLDENSFHMYGKDFKPQGYFMRVVRKIIFKLFQVYYDKRNYIGSV